MNKNSNKNWSFLISLTLILITLSVFYQVYSFSFVNYDDPGYVYKNPNVQAGITLETIKWAFTTGHISNWHPLTWLSHMLDWQMFGSNAGGHHITNLIFHIANTLLLFFVLRKMTDAIWPSAFVAALFALHPLHVESVAWVSERKDVLSTFFWLLTMWAYVRFVNRPKISSYLLAIIFFALGLMSKPMLVTLPFVLLLLDYWPLARRRTLYYLIREKIPFFALSVVSSAVTFFVQRSGGAVVTASAVPLEFRVSNAVISYAGYIEKMFFPTRLAMFYPYPEQNVFFYALILAAVLLAVTILILLFAKNHRYLVTGWFWYLGTLVPVIGLVQVGEQAMADRYSYITLTGLFIIIAWGLPELLGKWLLAAPQRKNVLWTASLIVLSVLSTLTYFQTRYWKDSISLGEHALKVTENNYTAHFCMTEQLTEQGRLDEAIRHNTEALRIKPDYTDALNGLGIALYKAGRVDEAIGCYKRVLEIDPRHITVYPNLGSALVAKGKFDEAISLYNKALQIEPDRVEIHLNLGVALVSSGRLEEAVKEYQQVLSAQPRNFLAYNDLGIILSRQGKFDEAIAHFNQAIRINPNYTVARNNLNIALAEKQKAQNKNAENIKK